MTAPGEGPQWSLTLYVSGASLRSAAAIETARQICDEDLRGRSDLEIIDLAEHPMQALTDSILAVPTLIKRLPKPTRLLVGDLSDVGRVRAGLDLPAVATS